MGPKLGIFIINAIVGKIIHLLLQKYARSKPWKKRVHYTKKRTKLGRTGPIERKIAGAKVEKKKHQIQETAT